MRLIGIIGFIWSLISLLAIAILVHAVWTVSQPSVIIEWVTATEVDTAGYNLYRSDQLDGTYVLVNSTLIPTSHDPWIGGEYSYEDENVVAGSTYYYILEDIQIDGSTNRNGPIMVDAVPSGRIELLLGIALLVMSLSGVILTYRRYRGLHAVSARAEKVEIVSDKLRNAT